MQELKEHLIRIGLVKPYLALEYADTTLEGVYEEDNETPAINRTVDITRYLLSKIPVIFEPDDVLTISSFMTSVILGIDKELIFDPTFGDQYEHGIYFMNQETSDMSLLEALNHLKVSPHFYLLKVCDIMYDVSVLRKDREYVERVILPVLIEDCFDFHADETNLVSTTIIDCVNELEEELIHG